MLVRHFYSKEIVQVYNTTLAKYWLILQNSVGRYLQYSPEHYLELFFIE